MTARGGIYGDFYGDGRLVHAERPMQFEIRWCCTCGTVNNGTMVCSKCGKNLKDLKKPETK